ncbi:MAG: dehydrogenase [Verrucomicrobiales bacterium]|nr:dehydrogenase [Verrucomicrobiales bacterium]
MELKPNTIAELSELLACANTRGEKISSVDLAALNRVLEHKAEDMTATVEAGMTLVAFQNELRQRGQWLPIDPPHPETLTIGNLLSANSSGPRRFGYGTIGDYLIGMKAVLADGRLIAPGGKVVKNVAGYDLAKIFVGGQGSLGVVVEATFKLRPLPERETFVQKKCNSLAEAGTLIEAVLDSELTPVVLDLHNTSGSYSFVLGFAGTNEEVAWQLDKASALGVKEPASLDYDREFWLQRTTANKIAVLPSKIIEAVQGLNGASFVARVGNGVIFHNDTTAPKKADLPLHLFQRLKDEYDPKHILPELTL